MLHCSFLQSVMHRPPLAFGVLVCRRPRLAVRSFITKRGLVFFCRIMFKLGGRVSTCCLDGSSSTRRWFVVFSLFSAHEWHLNDVLAFSHRETSHLPFSRRGCLRRVGFLIRWYSSERGVRFMNTCENKCKRSFLPLFLFSTRYVNVTESS